MRRVLVCLAAIALVWSLGVTEAGAANVVRAFVALTGGGTGAVDKIPIAEITDGDIGIAVVSGVLYVYQFSAAATDAEASPTYIRPDDYATAGVWVLASMRALASLPGSADGGALGSATLEWSDLFLASGGVIYGQADQSATLTSSASKWTANNLGVATQFDIGATGVAVTTDDDGAITITGASGGYDEALTLNFDDVENTVTVSTGTGVTTLNFSAIALTTTGAITGGSLTTGASATPTITLSDSDNAAGTGAINANSSGGANDIVLTVGVEDSTGESTAYIEVDGVTETVDFLKSVTIADAKTLTFDESAADPNDADITLSAADGVLTIVAANGANNENITLDLDQTANTAIIGSGTGLTMITTGSIPFTGAVKVVAKSEDYTIGTDNANEAYGGFFFNTAASTRVFTLPTAVAGMSVCIKNSQGVAQVLRLDAGADDYIVMSTGARTSAAAEYYTCTSSASCMLCVVAYDATDWHVTAERGTWAEE